MTESRRWFLRRAGGTVLAGSLCGCQDGGDGSTPTDESPGTTDDGGSTETPTPTLVDGTTPSDAATPTDTVTATPTSTVAASFFPTTTDGFAEWLPAPATVELDPNRYTFLTLAPGPLYDRREQLNERFVESLRFDSVLPGIDGGADIQSATRVFGGWYTIETPFDRAAVAADYREHGLSEVGTHRGFDVFSDEDAGVVALGDDRIVMYPVSDTALDGPKRRRVEAVIDAGKGEGARYREADTDWDRLVSALGTHHGALGLSHERGANFPDAVATGTAYRVGPERTRARAAVVFAEGTVHESAVASWATDADMFRGNAVSTTTDGRVVVADALIPTADISKLPTTLPTPDEETATPTAE